jgi:hypothetical protein
MPGHRVKRDSEGKNRKLLVIVCPTIDSTVGHLVMPEESCVGCTISKLYTVHYLLRQKTY